MYFVPKTRHFKFSVRTRLTVAFLFVVTLSWVLGFLTLRYFMIQDIQRLNREMAANDARARLHVGPMGHLSYGPPPDDNGGGAPGDWVDHGGGPPPGPDGPHGPGPGGPHRPDRDHMPLFIAQNLWAQSVISVVLALLAGWWLSRGFTRGLAALANGARAFHQRQFTHRIPVTGNDEFSDVAASMNEMADQVGAQIAALEEDAHRRQQILADVAHELRSPVATLEAMTAALQDGVAEQPERRTEALSYMRDSAGRMKRLVNDLLEVARLDLREVPLVCGPVNLCDLAEEVVETHRAAAEKAGIALVAAQPCDPVEVEADALRVSQVLANLVENAITYAGRHAHVTVSVTAEPPGIVVADTGAGIAAKHMPFIFDPFYRADVARTPGDNHSGLGLRIARGLMEAHGGTLKLESEEGHGTTASLVFQLKGENARGTTAEQSKSGGRR